jgi:hypothetical protein
MSLGAFLGRKVWDEDYVPYKAGFHLGNPNMPYMTMGARAIWAALLRELPEAQAWTDAAVEYFTTRTRDMISAEGGHMSCPHYVGASLDSSLSALLALQRTGRVEPFATEPRWTQFAEWYLNLLTPRDVRFDYRSLPSEGDGSTETTYLHAILANALRNLAPELSAQLMWAWEQQNCDLSSFHIPSYMMIDPALPAQAPALVSRLLSGFGAVLRHRFGEPEESYVLFIHRDFTHDHCHSDNGSFIFYGRGVPLCLDWGSIYSPQAAQPWYHNRLSWGHLENGTRQPPFGISPGSGHRSDACYYDKRGVGGVEHTVEPLTAFSEASGYAPKGRMTGFATTPEADYVEGELTIRQFHEIPYFPGTPQGWRANVSYPSVETPPFVWRRQMVFVKAEHPYLLIRDVLEGDEIPETAFNLWVMAKRVRTGDGLLPLTPHAAPEPLKQSPSMPLEFEGQWGVNLSVWLFENPAARVALGQWGHHWHPSPATKRFEQLHERPFEERQLLLRVFDPKSRGFFALLYPHTPEEILPDVTPIGEGAGVRLRFAEREDVVLCSPEAIRSYMENGQIAGRAGLIRHENGQKRVIVLDASGS